MMYSKKPNETTSATANTGPEEKSEQSGQVDQAPQGHADGVV